VADKVLQFSHETMQAYLEDGHGDVQVTIDTALIELESYVTQEDQPRTLRIEVGDGPTQTEDVSRQGLREYLRPPGDSSVMQRELDKWLTDILADDGALELVLH